jgi:hypothetical protein
MFYNVQSYARCSLNMNNYVLSVHMTIDAVAGLRQGIMDSASVSSEADASPAVAPEAPSDGSPPAEERSTVDQVQKR